MEGRFTEKNKKGNADRGIYNVSFSKDGSLFSSTHTQGRAFAWHTRMLDNVQSFPYQDSLFIKGPANSKSSVLEPVVSAAISNDNKLIAAGGLGNEIRIFVIGSGALMAKYISHTKMVTGLLFSKSGDRLISYGEDGTIKIWRPTLSCFSVTLRPVTAS